MAKNIKLTVDRSTASKNGGFILKLVNKTAVATPFGKKEQSITYYMKVADDTAKVGFSADLDLDQYDVVTTPFTIEDAEAVNNGETMDLKWIRLKTAA